MSGSPETKLDLTHPIGVMMAEHEVILRDLKSLRRLVLHLWGGNPLDAEQLATLKTIAHRLPDSESHHRREEMALFPRLEARDPKVATEMLRIEHNELRARKESLAMLIDDADNTSAKFLEEVAVLAGFISNNLGAHIDKEDHELYPQSLKLLTEADWRAVKVDCDRIGYCSFTPKPP